MLEYNMLAELICRKLKYLDIGQEKLGGVGSAVRMLLF